MESGSCTRYVGPWKSISSNYSPGLQFLAVHLLSAEATTEYEDVESPNAVTKNMLNGCEDEAMPFPERQQSPNLQNTLIERSWYDDHIIMADLDMHDGSRHVVCETLCRSVFRFDPKEEEVKVCVMLVFELEAAPEGKGVGGLWATEIRRWMDLFAIVDKAEEIVSMLAAELKRRQQEKEKAEQTWAPIRYLDNAAPEADIEMGG